MSIKNIKDTETKDTKKCKNTDCIVEDGSDVHMGSSEGQTTDKPEEVLIAQFEILDTFIDDVQNALGNLPYNHTIQVINNLQVFNLTIGNLMQLIKDTKSSIDINNLNFICECLTYYPYNVVKDIIDTIKTDQNKYFKELEPRKVTASEEA